MPAEDVWPRTRLGTCASIKARIGWKGLQASEYREDGYVFLATPNIKGPHIDFHNVNFISERRYAESPELMLEVGDVLLVKDGSTLGISNLVRHLPRPATVNGSIAVIRCSDKLEPAFLHQLTKATAFQKLIRDKKSGLGVPHLFQADLRKFEIPLPSLGEQRCVAQILDALDTAIHQTEAIIAKLEAIKQGLLHDLLTRGIDANGELRPSRSEAPHLYKLSQLGWIPKEWSLSSVGEQFEIQLGKMLDGQRNSGVLKPYVGNKAVQWDRIDLDEVQQVALSKSDLIRFRLRKGDLLVCEGGEVGRAAIWSDELDECYYQKALHRLRTTKGFRPPLMLEMLRYWMATGTLSEYVSRTSIAHLTQEKLASVPLPTPNVDEQNRLIERVLAAKHRIEAEEHHHQKLELLKAALMDDLLTGRVRVSPLLEQTEH